MSANKKIGSTKWHITTSIKNTGEQLCGILQSVYPGFKRYDKGFGWGDFNMIFENQAFRDEAIEDCNAAIAEYRSRDDYEPDEITYDPTDKGNSGNQGDEDGQGKNEKTSYYTYIIIGALVILAILLLWPGKRK